MGVCGWVMAEENTVGGMECQSRYCRREKKGRPADWDIRLLRLILAAWLLGYGALYQRILQSPDVIAATIVENYRLWSKVGGKVVRGRKTLLDFFV